MNILIIGSGGREHAFARQIMQSDKCKSLFVAPGNAGTASIANNLNLAVDDFKGIEKAILEHDINMVVVGPELPLVKGITNYIKGKDNLKHVKVIGPDKKAAQLEGSKAFAKDFMERYNIPTAAYKAFTKETVDQGEAFLETLQAPYVLKADGLAAGKGVLIIDSLAQAKKEFRAMLMEEMFGEASNTVVIEEFLTGIELSVFVLTDGKNYKILPNAKDYKRIGEGDTGLNTGGMGAISPVPFATDELIKKVEDRIVKPTIKGIQEENMDFVGFIFLGLMINDAGDPYMIEYNVRMGDPESEVVLPRIQTDLVEMFEASASHRLNEIEVKIDTQSAATVMLVSGGYPIDYEKGKLIEGIDSVKDSIVYHAGTILKDGDVLTNGGRVIAVTSLADTFQEAIKKSYQNVDKITFDRMYYRSDIGTDLL